MMDLEQYNFTAKQRAIVIAAEALFRQYGYKRVPVEEICREARVSKMTFYKYYSNKSELVKFLWNLWFEQGLKKYDEIMTRDIPFTEKLHLMLKLKEESVNEISHSLARDYFNAAPELEIFFKEIQKKHIKRMLQFIRDEQKKGNVRSDMKAEFFLAVVNKLSGLIKDEQLVNQYERYSDFVMEINNFIFYGISNVPDESK